MAPNAPAPRSVMPMTHGLLPCPRCGVQTDSLKAYRLPLLLLFLGVAWSLRHGTVVACPRCVRRELGRLTLVNALPANLLWVLLLLPWYSIAALRTLTHGHSPSVGTLPSGGGYRDPAPVPQAAQTLPSGSWGTDPALAPYIDPARPDELQATFVYPHRGGTREQLPVRFIQNEGDVYRAVVLRASQVEPGVHEGLEIFVRPSSSYPPLVWLPPAARDNLRGWDARCSACGFDLAFTPALEIARAAVPHLQPGQEPPQLLTACPACAGPMTLTRRVSSSASSPTRRRWRTASMVAAALAMLMVGVAAADSESAGVAASYAACVLVGIPLGAWMSADWAAREGKPWFLPPLIGVGAAVALLAAALVFFEGIFPAL